MDRKKPAAPRGKKRKKKSNDQALGDEASAPTAELADARAAVEVEKLIQSLSRASLERLVADSLQQNAPVTLDILQRAQPRQQPAAVLEAPPQARVHTGAFDAIDTHTVLRQILGFLPLQDRIVCASAVCKPWRQAFRSSMPGLWDDLTLLRPTPKNCECCCQSISCYALFGTLFLTQQFFLVLERPSRGAYLATVALGALSGDNFCHCDSHLGPVQFEYGPRHCRKAGGCPGASHQACFLG